MSSILKVLHSIRFTILVLVLQNICSSAWCKMVDIDEETNVFNNSVFGDNDLWNALYDQCGRRTSYQCVKDNMFSYLDRTLDSDLFVTDGLSFRQNENNYTDICLRVKKDDPGDYNERLGRKLNIHEEQDFSEFVDSVEEVERVQEEKLRRGKSLRDSDSPLDNSLLEKESEPVQEEAKSIKDVSDILYDRGVKYLMTHDLEVALPSFAFGGGKVKISPRGFDEDGGAIVKLNVIPDQPQEGRLFFKQIQKLFKKKLMTSMMAAVLILKLLKLKAMFFLPLLLGVGTAKKILLKVLLFLFPALAHLFKLCSYYHHKHYSSTKFHHHHHQIAHHHHHVPVPIYAPVHSDHHSSVGELPAPYPSSYESYEGPGVYGHSRTEAPGSIGDLAAWGLGEYPASWDQGVGVTEPPLQPQAQRYSYPTRAQAAPTAQYPTQNVDVKRLYAAPAKVQQYQQYQAALTQRLQALTPRPVSAAVSDSFYGPMLARLDAVFSQLGVHDEGCKERVVCSMYKNPMRYSPHSNLVSAELSRDPSELQKPSSVTTAVVRFYRYIQAARDGQELKDCMRLYPACTLTTE